MVRNVVGRERVKNEVWKVRMVGGSRDGESHKRSQSLCGLRLLRAWDSDAVFTHWELGLS